MKHSDFRYWGPWGAANGALDVQMLALSCVPVGSRITCTPPPTDTDEDYLMLIAQEDVDTVVGALQRAGYELDNPSQHYEPANSQFNSWRKGQFNLIVTQDPRFFYNFLRATREAKAQNLMDKADRVTLFQRYLYGRSA